MKTPASYLILITLTMAISLVSCHKKDAMQPPPSPLPTLKGIYILCQGAGPFPGGDGRLQFYSTVTKTLTPDLYSAANGKQIGELPTDLEIYGSKMYIAVSLSQVLDVVDSRTSKLIREISMPGRYPGHVAFYKGNALISCQDGSLAVMDTATLTITKNITFKVPAQAGGLVVVNDKAYVTQPGVEGISNIVSVIDLATLTETKQIIVVPQPVSAAADAEGNVFILSQAYPEFVNCPPNLPAAACSTLGGITVIDSKTDTVKSFQAPLSKLWTSMAVNGDSLYYNSIKVDSNAMVVQDTRTQTEINPNFFPDYPSMSVGDMVISQESGEIFILGNNSFSSDRNTSQLSVFSKTGQLEYTVPIGNNTIKIALLRD